MASKTKTPELVKTRVLIVDDNRADRTLCRELMARVCDCSVVEAGTVAEALSLYRANNPDLVLLDYYLPGQLGSDFLRSLEKEQGLPLPVVMLTGEGSEEVAVAVMKHGALDYLPKSALSTESLRRATTNVLEKMRMHRALAQQTEDLATAREVAEAANRAKDTFLASMSHELRTPLTAIIGFAEELAERDLDKSDRKEAARQVLTNSRHLLTLINELLDLSRIEAGKLEIENRVVAPVEIAEMACTLLRGSARQKGLELVLDCDPRIPAKIMSDPTRLNQILLNLISNAIKFTELGKVNVSMTLVEDAEEPMLQFVIADTGVGMTGAQMSRLFQPFVQAEASTVRKFGGTGLGLFISKHLANLLGGDITVTSQPDQGSVFTVQLSAQPVRGAQLAEPAAVTDQSGARGSRAPDVELSGRILLAEDVRTNRLLIERILSRSGLMVTTAENGAEALGLALAAEADGEPFDLILMDMQMPVMDGYEATEKLRAQNYRRPIVALTAHAMAEELEKCLLAGCNAHASKPVNRQALLELIAKHIG
ncbi:MAG: response regulator [Planctomycetota bacterium]